MNKLNVNPTPEQVPTMSALASIQQVEAELDKYAAYVGLDVHKDSIVVAIALPGRQAATIEREMSNTKKSISKLIQQLNQRFGGELLLFTYEAGPVPVAMAFIGKFLGWDMIAK